MNISYVWENDPPTHESKSNIQESFSFCINHIPGMDENPDSLLVRLEVDKPQITILGVGYKSDGAVGVSPRRAQ